MRSGEHDGRLVRILNRQRAVKGAQRHRLPRLGA
jgi:hypothetical protein